MTSRSSPFGVSDAAAPVDPAERFAAIIAVLHRRTGQEAVTVALTGPGAVDLLVALPVAAESTFGGLVGLVRSALADPAAFAPEKNQSSLDSLGGGPVGDVIARSADFGALYEILTPGHDIETIAEQVGHALRQGQLQPDRRIAVLELAEPERTLAQVVGFGGGRAALPPRAVPELVNQQALDRPSAPALDFGGRTLSYRELDDHARAVAYRLVTAGGDGGQVVAVLAERSFELVISLLGVLKAGCAYLVVEPDVPPATVERLLRDAGVRLVLTQPSGRDRVPVGLAAELVVLTVDLYDPNVAEVPRDWTPAAVDPGDLAYISYTSGSTGEPKGVCVPHAAVSRLVREPDFADFGPHDAVLQFAPVAFDASTLEIWGALANGARLVLAPPGPVTPAELAELLRERRVTVAWLTAGLFRRMVTERLSAFAGLRHVLAGGDVVSRPHVDRLLAEYPKLLFTNGYGPTENTTFTTCWTSNGFAGDASADRASTGNASTGSVVAGTAPVPIGRPIRGTSIAILDAELAPVPVGVIGELYAAGEGLARGYLNRPAATAERFVADPHAPRPGGRLYRTGDLARWLADGTVEFIGRADQQVKVRGYRVEPGEVEAALVTAPGVRHAVVAAQPDGTGGRRLLAYVVPADPDADGAELAVRLLEHLRARLAEHLVPWAVLTLAELPLTRNGKVDRAALPTARWAPRSIRTAYEAPRTRLELKLAALWGQQLGMEPIGVDDDFFELGGHSLAAAELLTSVQTEFGVELPARTLYLSPTVHELAAELDGLLPAPDRTTERG